MPPKNKPVPPRRSRLTLSQLASYDDLLTDALVDNAYYWCTIRKNRSKYTPCRRFKKDEIRTILFDEVICNKDIKKAEARMGQLSGIQNFTRSLKTDGEREHFKRHMRKYMSIWLPDCAWEVGTTNRYTILTPEAAAFARRDIKKGEIIKYLCGTLVVMTPEEEKDLDVTRRDFSIVRSSRRKASALFLGPARFSNHDCNANASLITTGSDGMNVTAVRDIQAGEEITVTYGDDYFGIDNCECLCHTCEIKGRNGWAGEDGNRDESEVLEEVEVEPQYSLRSGKRKRSAETPASSNNATPDAEATTPRKRIKLSTPATPESTSEQTTTDAQTPTRPVLKVYGKRGRRRSLRSSLYKESGSSTWETETVPEAEQMEDVQGSPLKNVTNNDEQAVEMSRVASSQTSHEPSDVDMVFEIHENDAIRQADTPESTHSEEPTPDSEPNIDKADPQSTSIVVESCEKDDAVPVKQEGEDELSTTNVLSIPAFDEAAQNPTHAPAEAASEGTTLQEAVTAVVAEAIAEKPEILESSPEGDQAGSSSELSDLASDEEMDEDRGLVVKRGSTEPPVRRGRGRPPKSQRERKTTPTVVPSIEEPKGGRRPGDYERTKELLAQAGSIWADCHTCDGTWVQLDSHETHRECPRCERHSIMFGYPWPKTEQEKGDPERVKDHRTINRILGPEEQRSLRRKGRGLDGTPPVSAVGREKSDSRRASTGAAEELTVRRDGRQRRSARRSCA